MVKAGYVRTSVYRRWCGHRSPGASGPSICDLQIEYSLISRGIEREILPAVRELGISITAYGVLSRGLLSGSRPAEKGDIRGHMPRFSKDHYEHNIRLAGELTKLAGERGITAVQIAIAWVLSRGSDIVPVMGARTRKQLAESVAGLDIALSAEEIQRLEDTTQAAQIAGTRYDGAQMNMLDSER